MMVAPEMILSNHLVDTVYPATTEVPRWGGFAVFSLALITFLSRNDPGSPALRAVISGNLVVTGVITHALLGIGFGYYLTHTPPPAVTPWRRERRSAAPECCYVICSMSH
jgi:hypothetical protein